MAHTRITALWTGATGLPGYTRLRFAGALDSAGAANAAARMRTFFDAMRTYIPTGISITFAEVAQIYGTTGQLEDEVTFTPPATVSGQGLGGYNGAGGVVVNWITGAFWNGRRVRGRTYLVPLTGAAFDVNGTASGAVITAATSAAAALAAGSPELVVFSGKPSTGYLTSSVSGASVPDRSAVLRSRRD